MHSKIYIHINKRWKWVVTLYSNMSIPTFYCSYYTNSYSSGWDIRNLFNPQCFNLCDFSFILITYNDLSTSLINSHDTKDSKKLSYVGLKSQNPYKDTQNLLTPSFMIVFTFLVLKNLITLLFYSYHTKHSVRVSDVGL